MRIYEISNVTDGRDRNFGIGILLLVCYLTAWTHQILSIADVAHLNLLPYQTLGITNQAIVIVTRDVKFLPNSVFRTDILATTPPPKMVWHRELLHHRSFWQMPLQYTGFAQKECNTLIRSIISRKRGTE